MGELSEPSGLWGKIMFRSIGFAVLAGVAGLLAAGSAQAQVGEPTGNFNITIQQGATTIVNANVAVPAPAGYVQIGTVGPMGEPIILKMVTDSDPNFRIVHWYIDVPGNLNDINTSDGASLINPANPAPVSVSITGLQFTGTSSVTPLLVNNSTYLTAYMRDTFLGTGGRFYNLPGSNFYAPGVLGPAAEAQVPGNQFLDGNTSLYSFGGTFGQPSATWTWGAMPNPAAVGAQAITTNGSLAPGDGRVYELGLSVAFVGVPEPATLAFVLPGLLLMMLRKRKVVGL